MTGAGEEEFAEPLDDHVTGFKCFALPPEAIGLLYSRSRLAMLCGAPPLEQDPASVMLGLAPDSSRSLSNSALKQAMKTAGLKPSSLAEKLTDRGWEVATRDVFNWQNRGDASVPPALIQAIAEVTGTTADKLTIKAKEVETMNELEFHTYCHTEPRERRMIHVTKDNIFDVFLWLAPKCRNMSHVIFSKKEGASNAYIYLENRSIRCGDLIDEDLQWHDPSKWAITPKCEEGSI